MNKRELKDVLTDLMKQNGLSQAELARRTGLSQPHINKMVHGDTQHPTGKTLRILADHFGVTIEEMTGGRHMASTAEPNTRAAGQPTRMVPLISHVQAGQWCEATDPYPVGEGAEMVEAYGKVSELAYALEVTGDSMVNPNGAPSFPPGAKILADPAVEWLPGRFVIARRQDDNEAIFKMLVKDGGRMYLKSLNPVYPMIPVDETITICATVTDILQQRLV